MRYCVVLSHTPNPDIEGGYWSSMERPTRPDGSPRKLAAWGNTLDDVARKCRDYIELYDLGAGNWAGGEVSEQTATGWVCVARIAFNGRICVAAGGVS
jgi:hypothetical protein